MKHMQTGAIIRSFALILGLGLGMNRISAQVSAELVLSQEHFVSGESIVVGVKITNFSGRTLKLGEDSTWLQFSVFGENNRVVLHKGEPAVKMPFELTTSHVATRRVDIAPYFNFDQPGRYSIVATVNLKELGRRISTSSAFVELVSGIKIWEQDFGFLAQAGTDKEETVVRKYMLLQVTHKNRKKLYARVTDGSGNVLIRTFPIGGSVSFNRPDIQIDPSSRLHVLSQYASRQFNYLVISPDGDLLVRQTYEYDNASKPQLVYLEEGRLGVAGGIRRKTESDVPGSVEMTETTPAAPEVIKAAASDSAAKKP